MFKHIPYYAGDPILSLMEAYQEDQRTEKVNLSIGLYYDELGKVPFLQSVSASKRKYESRAEEPSLYLPMSGLPAYCEEVQLLLFAYAPEVIGERRIATVQTLGGSGALKMGGDFLKASYPDAKVYVSNPTWENHIAIFAGSGFEVGYYPYYDASTGAVDFDAMLGFLLELEAKSIIVLHPCCHNPTGADLTPSQWDQLIQLLQAKDLIPFLDMAYQGFGHGFEPDTYAITAMAKAGIGFLLSNSFSKIFSLYGERVGGLSVICGSKDEADLVLGQLKSTARKIYSNPPTYGARLVNGVLCDEQLRNEWLGEVEGMRRRMQRVRRQLYDRLLDKGADAGRFEFLVHQVGMFSYSGFSPAQVDELRKEHAIYLIRSGRICIAGLNEGNLDKVADAFLSVSESKHEATVSQGAAV